MIACRLGNDPHNEEIAQCLFEDYAKNRSFDRDRLLLACVQHTAVHRSTATFLNAVAATGGPWALPRWPAMFTRTWDEKDA
jgi:hypothetical protein